MNLHRQSKGRRLRRALAALGAAVALFGATHSAQAQTQAQAQQASAFEDTMAERMKACTTCHGEQGRAGPDGYYPRIAGKPAGYLYNQLLNFRDGRRHYGLMTHMVSLLSDDYLQEIAHYFADLDLPYPPPATTTTPVPDAVLARGRELALQGDASAQLPSCAACHGERLTGVEPRFPGLVGLPVDYLTAQLGAWQHGQRHAQAPDCMAEIRQRLSAADAYAVVNWLARQPVPADARPAPASATQQPVAPDLACGTAELDTNEDAS